MIFQYPAILLLLWILPVVAWLLVRAERKRAAAARRFVGEPMAERLMPRIGGSRPWVKGTLIVLSLALMIAAAARPRFGVYYEKVVRRGVDCFVLLDVSRSMLAEDVAPNRLERAKSDICDLLRKLAGDRVGLIVFAGKPSLKVPLTTDEAFFRTVLNEVNVRSAPRGGTLTGDAIRKALEAMPPQKDHDQVLVVFTDGEDQDSFPVQAAKQAAERGVKIFTIGLGDSAEGARIPIRDESGKLVYLKDDGKEHWSKADHSILEQISTVTGGAHVPAGTKSYDMGEIYEERLANLTRSEDEQNQKRKLRRDRYQIFLMLAVVLFGVEMMIPAYPRRRAGQGGAANIGPDCRRRLQSPKSSGSSSKIGVWRRLLQYFSPAAKCVLFGLILLLPGSAMASPGGAAKEVNRGLAAFRDGDYKTAIEAFSAADRELPYQAKIAFDLGCAYARGGKPDEAVERFRQASTAKDAHLAATALYNLGCLDLDRAKKLLGEKPEEAAQEKRSECLDALQAAGVNFRDALTVDPEYDDARYNLETIRLWKNYIEEAWRLRDRDKLRQELDLFKFIEMMENRQGQLRSDVRAVADQPRSPLRREQVRKIEKQQYYLAEEIEPLKAKVAAALTGSQQQGGAPQTVGADSGKAAELLNTLADDIRVTMQRSADRMAGGDLPKAETTQKESSEKLDQVFMAVSPFVSIVQKAIKTEEGLISQSKGKSPTDKNVGQDQPGAGQGGAAPDWNEAAWRQRFIGRYARILSAKAQLELEQLEKNPEAVMPAAPAAPDGKPEDAAAAAEKQKRQREELKRALNAGVELSPKVEELSRKAEEALEAARPENALPHQEEALKLLKEMLPKQEQQQDQQNQDQQNKDQQKQDQKDQNEDQEKQDQKDKQNQKDKQDPRDKDNTKDKDKQKDQDKNEQQEKDKAEKDQKKDQSQAQPREGKLSKREAEELMRRARERRRQKEELEKALLERIYRPEGVDKDW